MKKVIEQEAGILNEVELAEREARDLLRAKKLERIMEYWFKFSIIGLVGAACFQLKYSYERNKNPNFRYQKSEDYGEPDVGKGSWVMVNTDGDRVCNTDYLGRYTLIYFGFTFCPDVCPKELRKLAGTIDILKERGIGIPEEVVPIFVSVDPIRDSPQLIRTYLDQFHKDFIGLTGSVKQLESFARVMRTYFSEPPEFEQDYILEHSTYSYFTNTHGEFIDIAKSDDDSVILADKICEWIAEDKGPLAVYDTKARNYLRHLFNRNPLPDATDLPSALPDMIETAPSGQAVQ